MSVWVEFSWSQFDKAVSFLLVCEGQLLCGSFISCVQEERGDQSVPFVSSVFQVPLAQNNPYAKVAYFGVAYLGTSHLYTCFCNIRVFSWWKRGRLQVLSLNTVSRLQGWCTGILWFRIASLIGALFTTNICSDWPGICSVVIYFHVSPDKDNDLHAEFLLNSK